MQRERKLDDSEVRPEMAAVFRARFDESLANFGSQDIDIGPRQRFEVAW
jgi:hypothetical protein